MNYYIGDACKNTFVLFDRLETPFLEEGFLQEVHQCLIKENKDDALILYDGKVLGDSFYVRMAVLGLDGVIAEFCGNGARVCAAFLFSKISQRQLFLTTPSGIHALEKHGDLYSVKLPPASFALNKKFIADAELFKGLGFSYVDMLEPHLILDKELSDGELFSLGKELNQRRDLFPHGINVNAWSILNEGHLFVKTYERGVQRLTQSCGTGSMSCAAFYKPQGLVSVSTPGGELQILLQKDGIVLNGPAFFSCSNKIEKAG